MKNILVAGFEAYGNTKINPAEKLVQKLEKETFNNVNLICKHQLYAGRQRPRDLNFRLSTGWTVQPGRNIIFIAADKPNTKHSTSIGSFIDNGVNLCEIHMSDCRQ